MGKQIAILIISLFLLIFGGIWEIKYLERTSRYLASEVEYTKNAIENNNFELADKQMESMQNTWGDMNIVWNIFINHDRIDDLEEAIEDLDSYIYLKQDKEAINAADRLNKIIYQIVDKQKFSFEHIL